MNLLISEPPLLFLPSLAKRIGLNKSIVIQQMHYWLIRSDHVFEGKRWIYNSVTDWLEQFPFWSRSTLTRIIDDLEADNLLFVGNFNKIAMDRTKWYSINYDDERLFSAFSQNEQIHLSKMTNSIQSNRVNGISQNEVTNTRDYTETNQNNNVEQVDIAFKIIEYLNIKANKNYKSTTAQTKRLINGRLAEGYTLEDFKRVIDVKVKDWLHHKDMNKYLRPDTLFNATKFEAYLNEAPPQQQVHTPRAQVAPVELDFNAGEDVG